MQQVAGNTQAAFNLLKECLGQEVKQINETLASTGLAQYLACENKDQTELQLRLGNDLLLFQLSPHVFEFHKSHGVWNISYVYENKLASYAGIINLYNFIYKSYQQNRKDDVGYLIGRIFINKDNHYFVEGKRQLGFLYNDFGHAVINKDELTNIIQSAILYSLDFNMLVPPYDEMKITTVAELKERIRTNESQMGKRLGFRFYLDNEESNE